MKFLTILLTCFFTTGLFAASLKLDLQKSTVKWHGKKVAGAHNGNVKLKSGKVHFSKDNQLTGGEFVVDMNTITNNDVESPEWRQKLVDHLKSDDFFNIKKHPTSKFVITKVEHKKDNDYTLTGNLTIKGITKPVTFPATINTKDPVKTATATLKIDRLAWDIKYNSGKFFDVKKLGDNMIYDEVEFELDFKTEVPAKKAKKS